VQHLGLVSWDERDVLLSRASLSKMRPALESLLQADTHGKQRSFAVAGEDEQGETTELMQHDSGMHCEAHWNCKDWLVCSNGVCSSCESNHQCEERNPSRQCFSNISWAIEDELNYNVCKHKPLFFPFTSSDFSLACITFLTIALAAPTGTGGGGILVPMYMIVGQFSAHSAVPLSKATIVGGAIANNLINIQRRHPFANRPIVNYDALQLLVPNLIAGTIFGVLLNAVSPDWLITIGLVFALGYSGFSAGRKAWSLYAEESRLSNAEIQPLMGASAEQRQLPAQHYSFDSKDNMSPVPPPLPYFSSPLPFLFPLLPWCDKFKAKKSHTAILNTN